MKLRPSQVRIGARIGASVLIGVAVAGSMAGCAFITPQQTTASYQASDGVNGEAGGVDIRNAMLISTDGTDANLVTVLVNTNSTDRSVEVQYASSGSTASQTVTVPANSTVQVTPESDTVLTLSSITAPLGSLFDVSFVVSSSSTTLQVPVLNTSLPGYSTLAPTPTPTDSLSPTPTDSATPSS